MAIDASQVSSESSSSPNQSSSETTGSSAPSSPEARSGSALGWLRNRFSSPSESSEANSGTPSEASTEAGTPARPETTRSTPEPSSRPSSPETDGRERSAPRHVFQTDEEMRRYEQSVADRAIQRYREQSETKQRQDTLQRYRERIKQARSDGDMMLAGELASELQDFEDGVLNEQHSSESIRAAQEEAAVQATAQVAAQLDRIYTQALHEDIPAPLQKEFAGWWEKEMAVGSDGQPKHNPEQARGLIVKQLLKLHAEHYRQLGRDDVLDDIDKNPELRKTVIAYLNGATRPEPPSVTGTANPSPAYRTRREIIDAVGNGDLTPKEAQPLLRKVAGAGAR